MDVIVVGAGAVGTVIGGLLAQAGHHVSWLAHSQTPRPDAWALQRAGTAAITSGPLRWIMPGAEPPASAWVIVCVRTPQLVAALRDVAEHLGPTRAVAIATVTLDGARAAARSAGLSGPVLALHVSFGAGALAAAPERVTWFPFSLPTTVSAEGQRPQLTAARQLATALSRAGLPTTAALSRNGMMRFIAIATTVVLPAWELHSWRITQLAADRELRELTARALHECARAFAPTDGWFRWLALGLPRVAYALALRALPLLMGQPTRALWLAHGPKVHDQTRHWLNELLSRAAHAHTTLPALSELRGRWLAACAENPQPLAADALFE
ncbi:MAG: 2-dehydropantoate 2-reductase N-terminal domain-containing protein [Polyangiales bacterium]